MDDIKKKFFLIVNSGHIALHVINKEGKLLFSEEFFNKENDLDNNFNNIKKFLDQNIFKIEKKLNLYIQEMNLIIDDKSFVNVDLSLIKDFKYSSNEKNNLSNDFSIIKESIETSNNKFELVHMVIKNYIIDKKLYLEFPEEIDQKNFFLQLRFICLDTKVLFNFKKILSKYQISLEKVFNFDYVNSFKNDKSDNISLIANKLIEGLNKNEINLSQKNRKNLSFFEKFFKFFT